MIECDLLKKKNAVINKIVRDFMDTLYIPYLTASEPHGHVRRTLILLS